MIYTKETYLEHTTKTLQSLLLISLWNYIQG